MPDSYTLIFLGTPDFALPALQALHDSRHTVALVLTQPDRPKGRGRKLVSPPVKTAAEALGCSVMQTSDVRSPATLDRIRQLQPDFLVVVAFGQMLPADLLAIPTFCALNIHPSLLPRYRGPAPIQRAIINGDEETGITIISLDTGMDSGDILMAEKTVIAPEETAATLHEKLAEKGATLLLKTLDQYANGAAQPTPQDHDRATLAPLLKKSDGRIDWRQPTASIDALVRGVTPWPGAFSTYQGKRIKIFKVAPADLSQQAPPGTIIKGFESELRIATGDGALSVIEIQSASGKRMLVRDFKKGNECALGSCFDDGQQFAS